MKITKYLFKINVWLFLISCGTCIFFVSTSLYLYISNIKAKIFFQKIYVKVEGYDVLPGDGSASEWPVFRLNGKTHGIGTSKRIAVDSFYYVWYNAKLDRAYLTTKESKQYDVYKLRFDMKIGIYSLILSVLTFYSARYLYRYLEKNDKK